jgi:hypothetical protein
MKLRILLVLCLLPAFSSFALADTVWDENPSEDGDLSGNFSMPTEVEFFLGSNTIIGTVGDNGNTGAIPGDSDADFFTFSVGAGQQLSSIFVDSYTSSIGGGSFIGYVGGTSFTIPDGEQFPVVDGFTLFNAESGELIGGELGGPLGAGNYSFWIQETGPTVIEYQLSFQVSSAVPEPTGAFLLALVTLGCASRRKRMVA